MKTREITIVKLDAAAKLGQGQVEILQTDENKGCWFDFAANYTTRTPEVGDVFKAFVIEDTDIDEDETTFGLLVLREYLGKEKDRKEQTIESLCIEANAFVSAVARGKQRVAVLGRCADPFLRGEYRVHPTTGASYYADFLCDEEVAVGDVFEAYRIDESESDKLEYDLYFGLTRAEEPLEQGTTATFKVEEIDSSAATIGNGGRYRLTFVDDSNVSRRRWYDVDPSEPGLEVLETNVLYTATVYENITGARYTRKFPDSGYGKVSGVKLVENPCKDVSLTNELNKLGYAPADGVEEHVVKVFGIFSQCSVGEGFGRYVLQSAEPGKTLARHVFDVDTKVPGLHCLEKGKTYRVLVKNNLPYQGKQQHPDFRYGIIAFAVEVN